MATKGRGQGANRNKKAISILYQYVCKPISKRSQALNKTLQENHIYSTWTCVTFRNPEKGFTRKAKLNFERNPKKSHCQETDGSIFYVHVHHVMRERNPRKAIASGASPTWPVCRVVSWEKGPKEHGARKPLWVEEADTHRSVLVQSTEERSISFSFWCGIRT